MATLRTDNLSARSQRPNAPAEMPKRRATAACERPERLNQR